MVPVSLIIAFVVLLFTVDGRGQSSARPFWTEQAMFRVGEDLYFVGVASCARTVEEGRQRAFESGMRELGAYAQERDLSRLLVETAMIYEEPNAGLCQKGTISVWRLLRVDEAKLIALPRPAAPSARTDSAKGDTTPPPPVRNSPVQDLTPHVGMTREDIAQRFGKPKGIRKQGQDEVWEYAEAGLTITFSLNETLVSWHLSGKPDRVERSPDWAKTAESTRPAMAAKPQAEASTSEPAKPMSLPPSIPLSRDPVEEGRKLFNGKGACHTCHGRDADMFTDVRRDEFYGVMPGYLPPIIGPFAGPSPRRVPPNLRDWSALRFRTDLDLYRAIKDGIGGSAMTGTRHLSDAEISDLIAYLNSLR